MDINYVRTKNTFSFSNISNVIVAVVDNGVYAHADLPLDNVSYDAHTGKSPSYIYGDHGTKVAGVIGATTNNNMGIAGVASGVKLMPISICYTDDGNRLGIPASTSTQFANAIRFAANNGARVINNSWSFDTSSPIPVINNAINYAHEKGCVVVFSSGNNTKYGIVAQPQRGAPEATLVVGAIDSDGNKADYSGGGLDLDVVAPGSGIWTTTRDGSYAAPSGTSFAAPHVAGIAALMLSENPDLSQKQIVDIIESTAQKIDRDKYSYENEKGRPNGPRLGGSGYGLVDAYAAVSKAVLSNITLRGPEVTTEDCDVRFQYDSDSYPDMAAVKSWEIEPSSYTITRGGGTSHYLNIKFSKGGIYTITVRFVLPDGKVVGIPKFVSVFPNPPAIYSNEYSLTPGSKVTFFVAHPRVDATYKWFGYGVDDRETGPEMTTIQTRDPYDQYGRMMVYCRVKINGLWSGDSNWVYLPF